MKTLSVILILILLLLASCVSIARRDVVYETDSTSFGDRSIIMGRVLSTQFTLQMIPIPLLPTWENTEMSSYGNISIVYKRRQNAPNCPSIELNGRFYFTKSVLSDTAEKVMCESDFVPMKNETELVSLHFQDTTYKIQYTRKILWFWGLCGYEGYCENDFDYELVWGRSR